METEFKQYDLFTVIYIGACCIYLGITIGSILEQRDQRARDLNTKRYELEDRVERLEDAAKGKVSDASAT